MTETAVCKWCKEPISLKSGWWIDSDNDVLCSHRETDIHEPSPAVPDAPTKCKYGDPYCPCQDGDPCHYEGEKPMPMPQAQTVPIPRWRWVEDEAQDDKFYMSRSGSGVWVKYSDHLERIARAEATIAELKESPKAMKQRAEMAEETLNDVMSESSIDEYLRRELRELVEHVNSLPAGHYSPWLTWWARNAARATGKES